jgi:hypothetical protein
MRNIKTLKRRDILFVMPRILAVVFWLFSRIELAIYHVIEAVSASNRSPDLRR